ncbi:MAG: FKBP-type peptidyl-prolyl cis-trans isomerase [Sphingobacteriales bacterium]|nr:FKBP-type peptidyl-prolyl cis-trans isomerase [Sphingobacteriales bacterium]
MIKQSLFVISLSVLGVTVMAQPKTKVAARPVAKTPIASLKTKLDSLSYAFGQSVASQLKNVEVKDLNYAIFRKGVEDGMKGAKSAMSSEQMNNCLNEHFMGEKMKEVNAAKAEGKKFLAENKKRSGVIELPNGLQYEIIKTGNGPVPKVSDTIVAHYAGTLLNGKEFDNSYKRGEPIRYPANHLVKGWTEALTRMPAGSKWKLYIPSDLGYGDYGQGEIPGGAVLVFEMELLEVIPDKGTGKLNN